MNLWKTTKKRYDTAMKTASIILDELLSVASAEKAVRLSRFFKTGPGEYGEGDCFLGIPAPLTRRIAKANMDTPPEELQILLDSPWHEARLCALLVLVERFKGKTATNEERGGIHRFYLKNAHRCNNWDLVDSSCPTLVGNYLLHRKNRSLLYRLAGSGDLWKQRIAIVSTMPFIRHGQFDDTIALSKQLMDHKHDLMHKAVGWMLREIGKRDREALTAFLDEYAARLPRTALRYAIEHYPEEARKYFLGRKQKQ